MLKPDPKVKVKNEADRVLVCQRKAHTPTHVYSETSEEERGGGAEEGGYMCGLFHVSEGE